jgi:hypothetical protein
MSYMLLILEPNGQRRERGLIDGRAVYQRMLDYSARLRERGVLLAVESLGTRAARLSNQGGRRSVVDGPFTEAKELVGGFFLLQCASYEEALGYAAECPAAEWATVEVRETGPCYE